MSKQPVLGAVTWRDLSVDDANGLRDFYAAVAGWKVERVAMGGYDDYAMAAANGEVVAGVCHRRGVNADLPAQWMIYVNVDDVDRRAKTCRRLGGKVLSGPRDLAGGRVAVIQDPAGAVCALFEHPKAAAEPGKKKATRAATSKPRASKAKRRASR